jgi:hypothetical protein
MRSTHTGVVRGGELTKGFLGGKGDWSRVRNGGLAAPSFGEDGRGLQGSVGEVKWTNGCGVMP